MEINTQPQRKTLQRLCTLGRIAGWVMIVMGALGVIGTGILLVFGNELAGRSIVSMMGMRQVFLQNVDAIGQILIGFAALGIVQFIRYAVGERVETPWLLRKGHIFLCLLALILLLTHGLRGWPYWCNDLQSIFGCSSEQTIPMDRRLFLAFRLFASYLPVFTKLLCILGVAALLRTVLPVMAESKTLV